MRRSKAKFRRQQSIKSAFSKAKRCPEGIEGSIEDGGHGFHAEGDAAADEVSTATLDCDPSSCQASSAASTFGDVGDSFIVNFCSWSVHPSGLSSEAKLRCSTTILLLTRVTISLCVSIQVKGMS